MRDIAIAAIIFGLLPFVLKRPTWGIYLWVWVSVMNPHRLAFGFAYNFPFAFLIAIFTLGGAMFAKVPRHFPLVPITMVQILFVLWMCVTLVFAINFEGSLPTFDKVMKIQFMVFVTMYLLHSRQHIDTLIWVMALSVAYYGIKGGIFTVLVGGEFQVWGPPGSFIEDNNHLATATVMTIPLLRYLQVQTKKRWLRWVLMGSMVSCFFSVLGSHSRGAFLACAAMLAFLWMKGRHKAITAIVLITLVPVAIGFMPDKWEDRMKSIQNYEEDASASSRLGTWRTALALANDRPITGAGFEAWNEYVFSLYAPPGVSVHSAHSIYFQILGEHGYVGLVLFLLMWFLVWREASRIAKLTENWPEFHWAYDLSRMIQTALVGYAVGGAFLNLAYYDVPYNILAVVVLTKVLVDKAIKERPGAIAPGWAATPAYGRPPPRPDTPAPHALPPLNRRA